MAHSEPAHICRRCAGFPLKLIESNLYEAIRDFRNNEPDIDKFTSETHQTEWNLAAHLAPEIARRFNGYTYDMDVIKPNYDNKRPDIIIHSRGTNEKNLLVIEVKKQGSSSDVANDEKKIRGHWFTAPLSYCFGATINLDKMGTDEVKVFSAHHLM